MNGHRISPRNCTSACQHTGCRCDRNHRGVCTDERRCEQDGQRGQQDRGQREDPPQQQQARHRRRGTVASTSDVGRRRMSG